MNTGTAFERMMEELKGIMDGAEVSSDEMKAVIVELSEQTGTPAAEIAEYAQSKIAEGWKAEGVYKLLKGLGEATARKKTGGSSCAEEWKDNIMRRFTRTN